jgi:SET and MYND domain-containing protein
MDISERNHLLGPKKREEWLEIDRKIRLYLFDSPLMTMDVTPLEILLRDVSNSFSVDKYDRRAPPPEASSTKTMNQDHDPSAPERPELESSGYATFPLASYFNHNCRPNCAIGFDMNANIVVKTTRTIEEGEELTISYNAGDLKSPIKDDLPFKSLMRRCKKLCREVWCFECDCVDL